MEHLPSRSADLTKIKNSELPGQSALMADFEKLRRDLEAEGFFKPNIPHVIFRLSELLALFIAGFYLLLNNNIMIGLILMGIAQGRCGWLMHEGGHYSLTGNQRQVYFVRYFNCMLNYHSTVLLQETSRLIESFR